MLNRKTFKARYLWTGLIIFFLTCKISSAQTYFSVVQNLTGLLNNFTPTSGSTGTCGPTTHDISIRTIVEVMPEYILPDPPNGNKVIIRIHRADGTGTVTPGSLYCITYNNFHRSDHFTAFEPSDSQRNNLNYDNIFLFNIKSTQLNFLELKSIRTRGGDFALKNDYVFTVYPIYYYKLFGGFHYKTRAYFFMENQFRIYNSNSKPVVSPSYMPGFCISREIIPFNQDNGFYLYANAGWQHHSNGQNGNLYSKDNNGNYLPEVNDSSGSFSNEYGFLTLNIGRYRPNYRGSRNLYIQNLKINYRHKLELTGIETDLLDNPFQKFNFNAIEVNFSHNKLIDFEDNPFQGYFIKWSLELKNNFLIPFYNNESFKSNHEFEGTIFGAALSGIYGLGWIPPSLGFGLAIGYYGSDDYNSRFSDNYFYLRTGFHLKQAIFHNTKL